MSVMSRCRVLFIEVDKQVMGYGKTIPSSDYFNAGLEWNNEKYCHLQFFNLLYNTM